LETERTWVWLLLGWKNKLGSRAPKAKTVVGHLMFVPVWKWWTESNGEIIAAAKDWMRNGTAMVPSVPFYYSGVTH